MASERFRQFEGRATKTLGGFRTFLLRGNVVDLAVGIVIGAAFTSIVNVFVSGIVTPLIPVSKNQSLSTLTIPIYNNGKLLIGAFLNAILSFLIVAAIIYFLVVLPVNALMNRYKPQEKPVEPAPTRDCPYCLSSIPAAATRCAYCTSPLPPPAPPVPPMPPAYGPLAR
ncbi:MAG: large conductance mechanosensitive channel protein MscL [Ktedonobacteraceae bacterium]